MTIVITLSLCVPRALSPGNEFSCDHSHGTPGITGDGPGGGRRRQMGQRSHQGGPAGLWGPHQPRRAGPPTGAAESQEMEELGCWGTSPTGSPAVST